MQRPVRRRTHRRRTCTPSSRWSRRTRLVFTCQPWCHNSSRLILRHTRLIPPCDRSRPTHMPVAHGSRSAAGTRRRAGLRHFRSASFSYVLVEREVRHEALQAPILTLQRSEPAQLTHIEMRIFLFQTEVTVRWRTLHARALTAYLKMRSLLAVILTGFHTKCLRCPRYGLVKSMSLSKRVVVRGGFHRQRLVRATGVVKLGPVGQDATRVLQGRSAAGGRITL